MDEHPPNIRNAMNHLKFIRQFPCLVCGDNTSTEAAHIRYADPKYLKPITGIGTKPPDCFTVPLCGKCHREQHRGSEKKYWEVVGIDPIYVALRLHAVSGDYDAGLAIINNLTSFLI